MVLKWTNGSTRKAGKELTELHNEGFGIVDFSVSTGLTESKSPGLIPRQVGVVYMP
jgi:hypothetical protein